MRFGRSRSKLPLGTRKTTRLRVVRSQVSSALADETWGTRHQVAEYLCEDGECGHLTLGFGFGYYYFQECEYFGDCHGVDFAARVVAFFDQLLEVAAGDLCGQLVGDDLAGALLLFHPCGAGQGNPHGAAVDVESDIDGVGVAGGDGHHGALPAAVQVLAAPAVVYVKIFVHTSSLSFRVYKGKRTGQARFAFRCVSGRRPNWRW